MEDPQRQGSHLHSQSGSYTAFPGGSGPLGRYHFLAGVPVIELAGMLLLTKEGGSR